jgi:hypothetical protein
MGFDPLRNLILLGESWLLNRIHNQARFEEDAKKLVDRTVEIHLPS